MPIAFNANSIKLSTCSGIRKSRKIYLDRFLLEDGKMARFSEEELDEIRRNAEAFQASKEIILCESIIDALTFWIAGFRNVTCSYGNQGFTEELYQVFIKSSVEVCWIAWDNDEKSNPLALQLAERLMAQGIKCMRIVYPGKIKDANEFAMKVKDGNGTAHGSLSMLMRNAEWLMPTDIDVTKRFVPKHDAPASEMPAPIAAPMQPAPKEESQPSFKRLRCCTNTNAKSKRLKSMARASNISKSRRAISKSPTSFQITCLVVALTNWLHKPAACSCTRMNSYGANA